MDVIKATRELGKVIQQDPRFLAYAEAKKANESDDELNSHIARLNKLQDMYQNESAKDEPDRDKLKEFDTEFRDIYSKIMINPNMQAYEACRREIDSMMNYVMGILQQCVNGEDPETCEPDPAGCGHDCSSCGGCG